jgi:hypothetical protein
MKAIQLILVFLIFFQFSLAQTIITGAITDGSGKPVQGVSIKNRSQKGVNTISFADGTFTIPANLKDTIEVSLIGFNPSIFIVNSLDNPNKIKLAENLLEDVIVVASSSRSSWVGATLFYNLDGSNLDNVVGAGKVKLNTVKNLNGPFRLNVIGNISKFSSATNTEKISSDILEISQSTQGLSAGLEPIYLIVNNPQDKIYFNAYGNLLYKLNNFQKVNNSDKDIALSQGRFTLGLEFDGIEFSDGGGLLHFGIEGSLTSFSKDKYNQIFNQQKSSLYTLEMTFIMPLFGKLGLMLNHTITQGIKPVSAVGMVIKN